MKSKFAVGDKITIHGQPTGLHETYMIGSTGIVMGHDEAAQRGQRRKRVLVEYYDTNLERNNTYWFWECDCFPVHNPMQPDMDLDEIHLAQDIYHDL